MVFRTVQNGKAPSRHVLGEEGSVMSPVWRRGGNVAEVRSDDLQTVALLHLEAGKPKVLNGTAATIWCLMDGQRSQDDISAILVEEFDDAEGMIPGQVEAFFKALAEESLVEVAFHGGRLAPGPRNPDKV